MRQSNTSDNNVKEKKLYKNQERFSKKWKTNRMKFKRYHPFLREENDKARIMNNCSNPIKEQCEKGRNEENTLPLQGCVEEGAFCTLNSKINIIQKENYKCIYKLYKKMFSAAIYISTAKD